MVKSLEVDESVLQSLKGFVCSHENLGLLKKDRVVYRTKNPKTPYYAVISGGGSGHEPLHAGFVGDNFLTAAVCGDVFASPSTKQILNAVKLANKDENCKGVLLIAKNYTGDVLHFGLTSERARSLGINCENLIVGEDISVNSKFVGRRALAGTVLAHKLVSAFATINASKFDLPEVVNFGKLINKNMITIGAALDHCKVPGRKFESSLKENQMELGLGIHNEPGVETLEPIPSVYDLIKEKMLKRLFKKEGDDTSFVDIKSSDEVLLLVNNLGGLSNFAISSIVFTALSLLKEEYKVKPKVILAGTYVTAFNSPGFSLTLMNLSEINHVSKDIYGVDNVVDLLKLETDAAGWNSGFKCFTDDEVDVILGDDENEKIVEADSENLSKLGKVNYKRLSEILKSGCESLKKAEPHITHLDSQVGDGDCGYTLVNGCNGILENLPKWEKNNYSFSQLLHNLSEVIEESMGGTSGGLYSIFISGCLSGLLKESNSDSNKEVDSTLLSTVLNNGLDVLFKYTKAREGDSTMIDALEPFIRKFKDTNGDFKSAFEAAEQGMNKTAEYQAKFGRASYVGESSTKYADPGAVGVVEFLKGISEAL
ncbi:related to Dihydroxyacetone kinase 1 [Hanseniaspora guilliermondii]|uniref:Related to Dihydroxyacetone kinase 1 n=1 Tax=Hanseniaspora guilliermondii TaxID=56406 RepID=A0A1L0FNB4_9ASCO|nr:related to Dihydroxyacetone kinase 1 [Hanseniaspora guilliermondii]